jgi:alpha-1,6-mannosyltransferase
VLAPGYLLAGRHAFDQLGRASGFVSFADPWRLVTDPLQWVFGHSGARQVIRALAWICAAVLALALSRGLPGRHHPRLVAPRAAAVLMLAWLLTAPYVLPWYAVPVWALIALLPASGYDRLLLAWTAILALAYLPGRQVAIPGALHDVLTGWKSVVSPVLLLAIGLTALGLSLRRRA